MAICNARQESRLKCVKGKFSFSRGFKTFFIYFFTQGSGVIRGSLSRGGYRGTKVVPISGGSREVLT